MKTAILNVKALQNDCMVEGHDFGGSLELLEVLKGQQIDVILDEEQYFAMHEKIGIDVVKEGDIGGIDWDKYDYVTIGKTNEEGIPTDFFSFKKEWLIEL